MAEFSSVVRHRRMTRAFEPTPLADGLLDDMVDLASRSPSAGKTQGWHLVVLEGDETRRFWDITLPAERRTTFRWTHLPDAPVIAVPLADPDAYVERYGESDKERTGLGAGIEAWPVPYWTIDASMAVMTLLLAVEDAGLGALFFGVFRGESELRRELGIPDGLELLGAVAIGHPKQGDPSPDIDAFGDLAGVPDSDRPPGSPPTPVGTAGPSGDGRSASRPRRPPSDIIHRGRW